MHHTVALFTSLASLGLVCAIYYCNILSRPGSWLRSEMLAMLLLSLLTGFFPIALLSTLVALWSALSSGLSGAAVLAASADLLSLGAALATMVVFRALVNATYRGQAGLRNVAPLTPHTPASGPAAGKMKKAA